MPTSPSGATIASLDERALIERIRARVPHDHPDLITGIGDDAAMLRPVRNRVQAVTTDMLVEGVHFRRDWSSPRDIGAKAVAVNVSDLGAMGAEPRFALLSLALPADFPLADFDGLADGVNDAAREAGVAVIGGNLTRSPGPLIVDVTAFGDVHPRKALRRDGARPGDDVYVTGTIGAGAAGLAWLERHGVPAETHAAWPAVRRACRPASSARAGVALSRAAASRAAIDLSDGLADGIRRVAKASGCGMTIDAAALPVDPGARAVLQTLGLDVLRAALGGGDDYELLFTVPARSRGRFRAARAHLGRPATKIGVVTDGASLRLEGGAADIDLTALGFDHFHAR
ncbi:MAG TPA: thiamine-phosphate kinase [Vicinamibacterales bacterium]|nr:thiamine-phosphate kinase [Vicinamibacterales bacterium]